MAGFYKDYFQHVKESAAWCEKHFTLKPKLLVVLSAGLDAFAEQLDEKQVVESVDIPHFPVSRAKGHSGKIILGKWKGVPVLVRQGRQHVYSGYAPQEVVFPYFVFSALGCKTMISTNAVGGIRYDLCPGDIVVTTDHINMMGVNPLVGISVQHEENQFPNMTQAYDVALRAVTAAVAEKQGVPLKEGVFIAVSGPNYETKAEIKAYRIMGADTIGMSTVPEVIAANYLGMKVLVLNVVANPAADRHDGVMTHEEVLSAMNSASPKVVKLLQGVVEEIK